MPATPFLSRGDLHGRGWVDRRISRAVSDGALVRARGGVYLPALASQDVVDACRLGGRLTCVSELARRGVFVLDASVLHVHLPRSASRLRPLARPSRSHWGALRRRPHPRATAVELFDALLQAVRCQPPRVAVATLDSALHLGLVGADDLDELFGALPRRYRVLRRLLDGRAEAGTESLVRLMLRGLGASVELQVEIPGVGRVDLLVDGWLIVECDSRAHHADWDAQRRDRRRDQAAAARGLATFRPIAEDILWRPDAVRAALAGLLAMRRGRA